MHLKFIWVLWRSVEKLHRNSRFLQCNLRYASLYTFSTGTRFIKRNYLLLFTTSRVYLEPTQWPAPSWLVSSVGRALHRYRRGYGLKSRIGLNFFFYLFECCVGEHIREFWNTVSPQFSRDHDANKEPNWPLGSDFLKQVLGVTTETSLWARLLLYTFKVRTPFITLHKMIKIQFYHFFKELWS